MRFYIFYIALINLELTESDLRNINRLLIILFLIQLPSTAIKFYYYGFAEKTPGIYGHGGGSTTLVVLISLGYIAGFYLFHNPRKLYLFYGVCFIFYGIVGKKASLLYFIPFQLLLFYYLGFIRGKKINILQNAGIVVFMLLSIFLISSMSIKFSHRLNKEKKVGGTIDYSYALKYSKDYTTGRRDYNDKTMSIGRTSTMVNVFNRLREDGFEKVFLGYGPGSITQTLLGSNLRTKVYKLKIRYGITGMTFIIAEYGIKN
jgi:hypothetical protein